MFRIGVKFHYSSSISFLFILKRFYLFAVDSAPNHAQKFRY
jgi:hypothetical protein